jgi:hypothetical protein
MWERRRLTKMRASMDYYMGIFTFFTTLGELEPQTHGKGFHMPSEEPGNSVCVGVQVSVRSVNEVDKMKTKLRCRPCTDNNLTPESVDEFRLYLLFGCRAYVKAPNQ